MFLVLISLNAKICSTFCTLIPLATAASCSGFIVALRKTYFSFALSSDKLHTADQTRWEVRKHKSIEGSQNFEKSSMKPCGVQNKTTSRGFVVLVLLPPRVIKVLWDLYKCVYYLGFLFWSKMFVKCQLYNNNLKVNGAF